MKKKVLSSLVLSGTVLVMAPQAWSQAGGASGAGKSSGSETQVQKPSDPPMGGQQRGSSSDLQRDRSSAQGGVQGQRMGGQQLSKDKVKQIQEALKEKGNDPGQIDGIMGPKTQQALRQFQKSENLQVTGRVDEKTASALGVDVAGSGASSSSSGAGVGNRSGSAGDSGISPGKSSSSQGAGSGATGASRSNKGSGADSSSTGSKGSGTDSTSLGSKGSTAGKLESTEGNPK